MKHTPPPRTVRGRRLALKLAVSAACLGLIAWFAPLGEAAALLQRADLALVAAALGLMLARNVASALRWRLLLAARGHHVPFFRLVQYYFIGIFFNHFMPTSLGGDVSRILGVRTQGVPAATAAGSVVLERVFGVTSLLLLLLGARAARRASFPDDPVVAGAAGLGIGLLAALMAGFIAARLAGAHLEPFRNGGRARQFLCELLAAAAGYGAGPSVLASALALTLVYQASGIVAVYLLSLSLGGGLGLWAYMFIFPMVWIGSMLPVSISGLGVREGLFILLTGRFGMGADTALAVALLMLAISLSKGLVGAAVFLLGPPCCAQSRDR